MSPDHSDPFLSFPRERRIRNGDRIFDIGTPNGTTGDFYSTELDYLNQAMRRIKHGDLNTRPHVPCPNISKD